MQPCTDRARLPIAAEMRSARADAAAVDGNFQEHNKVCRVTERAWVSAVSAPLHVACKKCNLRSMRKCNCCMQHAGLALMARVLASG